MTTQQTFIDAIGNPDVDLDQIKDLMNSPGIDLDAGFHEAVEKQYPELIQLFLARGDVDPTMDNNFALFKAIGSHNTTILEILLVDGRVDPSIDDNSALKYVILNDYIDGILLLLSDKRVNPDTPVTVENARLLNDVDVYITLDEILNDTVGEIDEEIGLRDRPDDDMIENLQVAFNAYFANYAAHALAKKKIKENAGDIASVAVLDRKKNLPTNVSKKIAEILTGTKKLPGTFSNILSGLKGNYFGPIRPTKGGGYSKKRVTRSRRFHRSHRMTKKFKNRSRHTKKFKRHSSHTKKSTRRL